MNTARRRIVRRAVMALVVVDLLGVGLAFFAKREPPEIQRSRSLRIGMTSAQVVDVMGEAHASYVFTTRNSGTKSGVMFGRSTLIMQMLGLRDRASAEWPVRVGFDSNGRVDRIERGDEVEEASPPQ